jgi:hypothetical protein
MATKFTVGNYYENTSREVVILITARTKCFVSYKEFWISDLINNGKSYTDGRVKVKLNEDGSEYILIDRFSEYKATNNYVIKEVKEVIKKEHYSAVHKNFLKVNSKYRYVDLKNGIDQDIVFEDANDNGAVLNFKAIDKNGNKFSCEGSLFVVTFSNRDCLKPFTTSVAIATEVVKEVKNLDEEVKSEELLLQSDNCDLPVIKDVAIAKEEEKEVKNLDEEVKSGELLLQSDNCDLPVIKEEIKIQPLTFKEIKTLAADNGYELEPLLGMFRLILIKNNTITTFSSLKGCKDFITLPPVEEEKLTKEYNEAIEILVKYDFNTKKLTQFEEFALASLKKYVESGEPPKLIKTFAEVLIKKLTPEERVNLRDRALGKVFIRN